MKARNITIIVAGLIAVAVIFIATLTINGKEPFGWDAPYYLLKDRLLVETGVFDLAKSQGGFRIGYTAFSVLLHTVTRIPFTTLERVLPLVMVAIIAGLTGLLAARITRRRSPGLVAGISTLFYFGLNDMALRNNSDNLFAYTFFLGYLHLLVVVANRGVKSRRWHWFVMGLLLTIIGSTHLETFALAAITTPIFIIFKSIARGAWSIRREWNEHRWLILVWIVVCLIIGMFWGRSLSNYSSSIVDYSSNRIEVTTASTNGYRLPISLTNTFLKNSQFGVYVLLPFVFLGIIVVLRSLRRATAAAALVAWSLALVVVFIVFYLLRFEYNYFLRILSLFPIGAFVGCSVDYLLHSRSGRRFTYGLLAFALSVQFNSTVLTFHSAEPFVPDELFPQLAIVAKDVSMRYASSDVPIVSVSTTTSQSGEYAYYGMWSNWVRSAMPGKHVIASNIHFGNPDDLFACRTTNGVNVTQTEYGSVSASSISAICHDGIRPREAYILESLSPTYYALWRDSLNTTLVGQGVLLVRASTTPGRIGP